MDTPFTNQAFLKDEKQAENLAESNEVATQMKVTFLKKEGKHDILNVSDKWKKFVLGEKIWEKAIHMMRTVFLFWKGWRLYAKDLECILEVSRQKDSTI